MAKDKEAIYRMQNRNDERIFERWFAKLLILLGVVVTIVFLIKSSHQGYGDSNGQHSSDISFSGQLGDFIGGIVGTIFSLAGVILLYITLRAQRESFHRERLENNFFEMIRFHRENVDEMKFNYHEYNTLKNSIREAESDKRKVFRVIFSHFKEINEELKDYFTRKKANEIYQDSYYDLLIKNQTVIERNIELAEFARIDITYLIIFFGVGDEGKETIKSILKEKYKFEFLDWILSIAALKPRMDSNYWVTWVYNRIANSVFDDVDTFLARRKEGHVDTKILPQVTIPVGPNGSTTYYPYYPDDYFKYYGGHQFRLGHYYRHLFQTVKFIDKEEVLSYKEKYSYVKILRGQLSTYEQVVLFLNSLSSIGRVWEFEKKKDASKAIGINNQLITKYNLIKNIPNDEIIEGLRLTGFYPLVKYEAIYSKENRQKRKELEEVYF